MAQPRVGVHPVRPPRGPGASPWAPGSLDAVRGPCARAAWPKGPGRCRSQALDADNRLRRPCRTTLSTPGRSRVSWTPCHGRKPQVATKNGKHADKSSRFGVFGRNLWLLSLGTVRTWCPGVLEWSGTVCRRTGPRSRRLGLAGPPGARPRPAGGTQPRVQRVTERSLFAV